MIKNVHVPVHQIDVNVTNPVVEERDTREDRRVLATVQNDIAAVVIVDTMRNTRIEDLIVAETSAEIVMGESLLCAYSSIISLVTTVHQEDQKQKLKNSCLNVSKI